MARVRRRNFMTTAEMIRALILGIGSIAFGLGAVIAHADVIMLRGGGQIQGKVVPDPQQKDRVQVWLLQGRKPLSFQKQQIVEVIPKASPLDGYVLKLGKTAETAQGRYDLGAWCDQNKLADLARMHYEAAVKLDKTFEPAHLKLGHVLHAGAWLNHDELSAAQGLFKYKGRWISAEEKNKHDLAEKATAAQASWLSRIKMLRQAIVNGPDGRRREAESQLMTIRDPEAVGPLVRIFGADERPQRIILAHVLATISGPASTSAQVQQLLNDPDDGVRATVYDRLKERDEPGVVPLLIRALKSSNLDRINRAAWALGNLGAAEAVPKLIPVLVSTDMQIVMVSPDDPSQGGDGGSGMPLAPLGVTKNGNVAVLTPPVVGNGVVAYGAAVVPYGAFAAGASPPAPRLPEPGVATFTYRNVEVLKALEKLTGQDFGYDAEAWMNWLSRAANSSPKKPRRVPQP
jgi:hypothetical protein